MTDRIKQLRVGIFVAVAAALIAVVLIVFGGMQLWKHRDHYVVDFDGTVMGLQTGAAVYLNGIQVGKVDDIAISPTDIAKVRIALSVDAGTPVRRDTHAYLGMPGLTGLKVVDLRDGTLAGGPLPEGGTLLAGQTTLDKLQQSAEDLADTTKKVMAQAQRVMANLEAATDPQAIQAFVASANAAASDLAGASRAMKAMVVENRAAITALVGGGAGFVADLRGVIRRNEATLQAALADLRQASRSFKDLAREVKEKPSRLLYSSAQPERR